MSNRRFMAFPLRQKSAMTVPSRSGVVTPLTGNKQIGDLPPTDTINDDDLLELQQTGSGKRATAAQLRLRQSGQVALTIGQDYVDVVFGAEQSDPNWLMFTCNVVNLIDSSALKIGIGTLTNKTTLGCRVTLLGNADMGNYFLQWGLLGTATVSGAATTYVFTGPTTGQVGVPSTNFTVHLPTGQTLAAPVHITPHSSAGGAFSPTSVTLTTAAPSATFTFTPASAGVKTISVTNDGGLTDPASINYTATVTSYTLTGPTAGEVGVPSTPFTVTLVGTLSGTVVITPDDGGGGGSFTPTSISLTNASPSGTFTYTPTGTGEKDIFCSNNRSLPDPSPIAYMVSAAAPHLLNMLTSYWKADEGSGATIAVDSIGPNNGTATGCSPTPFKINNGQYVDNSGWFSIPDHVSLHVTGDFFFSLWVRVDKPTENRWLMAKFDGTTMNYGISTDPTNGFTFVAGGGVIKGSPEASFAVHHLVVWYDSSDQKARMRIDDAVTYVGATTGLLNTPNTGPLVIGGLVASYATYNWSGIFDEIGFWNGRKPTAGEITALFNGGAALPLSSFTA